MQWKGINFKTRSKVKEKWWDKEYNEKRKDLMGTIKMAKKRRVEGNKVIEKGRSIRDKRKKKKKKKRY